MIQKKDKKGAEMTIGTIIVIILALVVLVFLIFAFARGGGSLMDYITNLFGGTSNIDTIKNSCNAACAAQQTSSFAYCEESRTLKVSKTEAYKGSCSTFASQKFFTDKGIEPCPSVTCARSPTGCNVTWIPKSQACANGTADITGSIGNSGTANILNEKCCV